MSCADLFRAFVAEATTPTNKYDRILIMLNDEVRVGNDGQVGITGSPRWTCSMIPTRYDNTPTPPTHIHATDDDIYITKIIINNHISTQGKYNIGKEYWMWYNLWKSNDLTVKRA